MLGTTYLVPDDTVDCGASVVVIPLVNAVAAVSWAMVTLTLNAWLRSIALPSVARDAPITLSAAPGVELMGMDTATVLPSAIGGWRDSGAPVGLPLVSIETFNGTLKAVGTLMFAPAVSAEIIATRERMRTMSTVARGTRQTWRWQHTRTCPTDRPIYKPNQA